MADISNKSRELKILWAQWDPLRLDRVILYRVWESENGQNEPLQIVVPRSSIPRVLHSIHDRVSGGHLGVTKTVAKLGERFYWTTYKDDVENWIHRYVTCAATKGPQTRSRGKLHKYNVGYPFERIALDLAGPFPMSRRGKVGI